MARRGPPALGRARTLRLARATRAPRSPRHVRPWPRACPRRLRLSTLDDALCALLDRLLPRLRRDTVLVLLSDHGTHGTWLNAHGLGEAEHRRPLLRVVVPGAVLGALDRWEGAAPGTAARALRANRRALVTPYDVHASLLRLATWPEPPGAAEVAAHARPIWSPVPAGRSCADAHIPAYWCLCGGSAPDEARLEAVSNVTRRDGARA